MTVPTRDMDSMQLFNFSRLRILAMNHNRIQTGKLIMELLPTLKELYATDCNLHVFPNLSDAPTLKIVQLH